MAGIRVGIIGGAGLVEALVGPSKADPHLIETPFGPPAGPLLTLERDGMSLVLLARHGSGHQLSPTRVPYRANLFALKVLGVTHVLACGTAGSLREHIQPRHLVIPDQVIDRTYRRPCTFYDDLAVHVEMASPFCETLRQVLIRASEGNNTQVHTQGTYVCMEGPALSTRAESLMYRSWGGDLVGMTAMPEAKLAREAELHYALVVLPTDYDGWQPQGDAEPEALGAALRETRLATSADGLALIRRALSRIATVPQACRCDSALAAGIWSDRGRIPNEVRTRLRPLLGKYLPPEVV
ncbi:MTAP family purine nucleoside phosphorylase [Hyalangium rubrum]|uniref:Purine nucleoside phosphorylase n=1 Tax=Hyalangium rubrum TaxID=3103134 RepID=A0ABU5HER2_9BACT|nr:MTAP family purine nucleoside phosphorylase [Hyalangium sp. s54d21]MDY7231962.1 MTAP family purine nucleoside phosphorylase [Hyalangium sp. s54d21]